MNVVNSSSPEFDFSEKFFIDSEFSADSLLARSRRSYLLDVAFRTVVRSRLMTLEQDAEFPFMSQNDELYDFDITSPENLLDNIFTVVNISDRLITDPSSIEDSDIDRLGKSLGFLAKRAKIDLESSEKYRDWKDYLKIRFPGVIGETEKCREVEKRYKEMIERDILSRLREELEDRGTDQSAKERIVAKYRRVVAYFIDPYEAYEEGKRVYMEVYYGVETDLNPREEEVTEE